MTFLREYLYVDPEKVKGLASQLFEGIPESTEETHSSGNKMQIGSSRLAYLARERGSDVVEKKSITDAIFPSLEEALEAEGFLVDISELASNQDAFESGEIAKQFTPGSLVRITSDARLIDPRFFARVMTGIATAAAGINGLGNGETKKQTPNRENKNQNTRSKNEPSITVVNLEDSIPDIPKGAISDLDTSDMRSMVKVMRGIYPEGVSMSVSPAGVSGPVISVRLQEGRQYLDAEPETLFGQYGLDLQEWTIVGTIGHHARVSDSDATKSDLFGDEGVLHRGKFVSFTNEVLKEMGGTGFLQLPQAPGFSLVPLAVYRTIPKIEFEDANQA